MKNSCDEKKEKSPLDRKIVCFSYAPVQRGKLYENYQAENC